VNRARRLVASSRGLPNGVDEGIGISSINYLGYETNSLRSCRQPSDRLGSPTAAMRFREAGGGRVGGESSVAGLASPVQTQLSRRSSRKGCTSLAHFLFALSPSGQRCRALTRKPAARLFFEPAGSRRLSTPIAPLVNSESMRRRLVRQAHFFGFSRAISRQVSVTHACPFVSFVVF
jgi:hypothetical protein